MATILIIFMRINWLNLTKIAPIIQWILCTKVSTPEKVGGTKHLKCRGKCPPAHPQIYTDEIRCLSHQTHGCMQKILQRVESLEKIKGPKVTAQTADGSEVFPVRGLGAMPLKFSLKFEHWNQCILHHFKGWIKTEISVWISEETQPMTISSIHGTVVSGCLWTPMMQHSGDRQQTWAVN